MEVNEARAVVLGSGFLSLQPKKRNEELFEIYNRCPELVIPFGYVALGGEYADTPDTVRRLRDSGARGLKAICPMKDYDDEFFPIYETAQELGMPIVFHTGTVKRRKVDRETARKLDISSKRMRPINIERACESAESFHGEVGRQLQRFQTIGLRD